MPANNSVCYNYVRMVGTDSGLLLHGMCARCQPLGQVMSTLTSSVDL